MDPQLRYLIIIKPSGLPVYSQSFEFETVFACQTFNNRLLEMGEKKELIGGYFSAIKDILAELIKDKLKLIDLGFHSYRMAGLVHENYLFIGIFEVDPKEQISAKTIIFSLLGRMAELFLDKYRQTLMEDDFVDITKFEGFTNDLIEMGLPLSMQTCRNCLMDCAETDMGCLPHLIYFKEVAE
jgi:hypothetical protein